MTIPAAAAPTGGDGGSSGGGGGSPPELKSWMPAVAADGTRYYYHKVTRAVRWERPEPDAARRMEERLRTEDEALRLRQAERLAALASGEEDSRRAAAERSRQEAAIERRLAVWRRGKGIRAMLLTLADATPGREVPAAIASLAEEGTPDAIKMAYKKAARVVHPDKMAAASVAEQVEAHHLFAILASAYREYCDAPPPATAPAGGGLRHAASATPATSAAMAAAAARARAAFEAMHAARAPGAPHPAPAAGSSGASGAGSTTGTGTSATSAPAAAGGAIPRRYTFSARASSGFPGSTVPR